MNQPAFYTFYEKKYIFEEFTGQRNLGLDDH